MAERSGVVFKDGPTGHRPALAAGPDVWEIVKVLREIDERGAIAVTAAAELLALSEAQVRDGRPRGAGSPELPIGKSQESR